jgi:hypothetical protein
MAQLWPNDVTTGNLEIERLSLCGGHSVFSYECPRCWAKYVQLWRAQQNEPVKDWARLVTDHYIRRGQVIPDKPTAAIDPRVMFTRLRLMVTELAEVADAEADQDLEKLADGLCDLLYVVVGTAVEHGLGPILDELFREVNRSNETKDVSRPVAPGQKYAPGVGKGAGYEPPRLTEIISRYINKGEN